MVLLVFMHILFTEVLPSCVYDTPWILEPTWSPRLCGHPEAAEQVYRTAHPHLDPQSANRGPTAALISTFIWIHVTSQLLMSCLKHVTLAFPRIPAVTYSSSSCYLKKTICVVSNFTNKDTVAIIPSRKNNQAAHTVDVQTFCTKQNILTHSLLSNLNVLLAMKQKFSYYWVPA